MKNTKTSYYGAFIGLVGSIGMIIIISLCSCSTMRIYSVSETSPVNDIIEWNTLYPMARYDSSKLIPKQFLEGRSMIIYMQDSSYVTVWTKKCEFRKNEMLYYIVEKWYSPGFPGSWCKYFLVNKEQTIKHTLVNQKL